MSKSSDQSPLRQENDRPQPSKSAAAPAAIAARAPLQKIRSGGKEAYITKAFGLPLPYLLREPEEPIPPPPTGELREAPVANPPHQSLKENSLDSPLRPPVRSTENQVSIPIPQTNREVSLSAWQLPLSTQNENASRSPGRDESVAVTQNQSVLEDAGSPMLQIERSPDIPVVANKMAAPGAAMTEKVGHGGVHGMRMESGVLRSVAMRRTELGIRVLEVVLCMVSFSVMAADKTSGWAGDSFDRYPEFRYCVSINVIAFVYSVFQVYAQFHHRMKKRRIIDVPSSYYLDFSMDQVLAYLLMSASSSAAARNDDWISMFGSDKFTDMINVSIAMSFLAFLAFALSSIISADKLFSWKL